jgi:hypothetical protein
MEPPSDSRQWAKGPSQKPGPSRQGTSHLPMGPEQAAKDVHTVHTTFSPQEVSPSQKFNLHLPAHPPTAVTKGRNSFGAILVTTSLPLQKPLGPRSPFLPAAHSHYCQSLPEGSLSLRGCRHLATVTPP